MNLTKKLAAVLLSVLMAVVFMPAIAFADDASPTNITSSNAASLTEGNYEVTSSYKSADLVVKSGTVGITLNDDLTGSITVNDGATLNLNLNGHNITSTTKTAVLNKGTLTVTGSGTVSTSAAGMAAVGNIPGATCELKGGNYTTSEWYVIRNMGKMDIYSPTEITGPSASLSDGSKPSIIHNGWQIENPSTADDIGNVHYTHQENQTAVLNIHGGKFTVTSASLGIKNIAFGTMTIDDGTFESNHSSLVQNTSNLTVNGGSFTGTYGLYNYRYSGDSAEYRAYNPGKLTINGGEFTNKQTLDDKPAKEYIVGDVTASAGVNDTVLDTTPESSIQINGGTFNRHILEAASATATDAERTTLDAKVIPSTVAVAVVTTNSTAATKNASRAAKAVKRNASTDTETKYAIGQKAIEEAAQQPDVIVEIQSGSVELTNVKAVVRNAATNTTGTVTVDNYQVKANESVAGSAGAAANLQSTINSLQAQLTSALNTNTANTKQIADLKAQIAKAQADLKTVQASLAQAQNDAGKYAAVQQVTEVTAKAGKNKATLTWASLGTNVTGYKIYRKTAGGSYKLVKKITKATTTKWTNKNLKKGKTYYFRIKGYRNVDGGQLWGTSSATVKVKVK